MLNDFRNLVGCALDSLRTSEMIFVAWPAYELFILIWTPFFKQGTLYVLQTVVLFVWEKKKESHISCTKTDVKNAESIVQTTPMQ